ncbi:hypothetical protein DL96DRAFT_1497247 [Flagelloscypha sp. PMI_526]|nr:hypothetical protein DL96DRAFT_1497247 [Flagelloscypha sp. PMI_526]
MLQFTRFDSLVQPEFWHKLTELKIDVLRLSDEQIPIVGSYTVGRSVKDRETGKDIALGTTLSVGADSFQSSAPQPSSTVSLAPVTATGTFKNFNTIEEFKGADKAALFNAHVDKIWDSIIQTRSTELLNSFITITFADLKKYKYFYWFAFPAFVAKPAWEVDGAWASATDKFGDVGLKSVHEHLRTQSKTPAFFLIRFVDGKSQVGTVESYNEFYSNIPASERFVGFIDPSAEETNPGWPLRNLLTYLSALYPNDRSFQILAWRDSEIPHNATDWKSRVFTTTVAAGTDSSSKPTAVGWEKNVQGKLGPRLADLAPMMDPTKLANQAVDLNLKLMRWRILPALDLEKVAETKCLLLGAGTLGCYVARTLMGWGVRTITLADNARVSFSNPVRQPLFEFEDCLNGGKPKAPCAAERLKKIFPGLNATGHMLSIPMPGHPIPPNPTSIEETKKDVATLEKLIDEHDVVFLLMDSRESRWLPSVIAKSKGKIIMNTALGFDTFLVMRHGARAKAGQKLEDTLGCYYCNDIVAPSDSLTDRTLDQMCTVTRPGLAPLASSTAVELLVSLLQHPDGIHAPAPPPLANPNDFDPSASTNSVLGMVPHQLRGFLAQFRNLPVVGRAYERCTGCSEIVLKAYETQGFDMFLQAFNDLKYLEKLTGLDKLHEESAAVLESMESVDWDEDEGGDDF